MCAAEDNINNILDELAALKKEDRTIRDIISKEMAITRNDITAYKEEMKVTCDDLNSRVKDNKVELDKHEVNIGKCNSEIKMMKNFEENL